VQVSQTAKLSGIPGHPVPAVTLFCAFLQVPYSSRGSAAGPAWETQPVLQSEQPRRSGERVAAGGIAVAHTKMELGYLSL